jgi:hypothetical protein
MAMAGKALPASRRQKGIAASLFQMNFRRQRAV